MQLRKLSVWKRVGILLTAIAGAVAGAGECRAAHPLRVQGGVLTVDGLTVETGVDLRIANLRYLYVYLPGSGTAVIAERPFSGAREQRAAFQGNALTVNAGGSRLQLTAANRMRGSKTAYVRFERGAGPGGRKPVVSYGDAAMVPALWNSDAEMERPERRRMKVNARRALRTAKLCRPSRRGKETCATIREVVYER